MTRIIREVDPLWVIVIISLISLLVAYITFGILQSTGAFNNEKIQLGGSAAGFFIVFGLIYKAYSSQVDKIRKIQAIREEREALSESIFQINFEFPEGHNPSFIERSINGNYRIVKDGKTIGTGGAVTLRPEYGWVWRPQIRIQPDYLIELELEEDNGKKWKSRIIPVITSRPIEILKGQSL